MVVTCVLGSIMCGLLSAPSVLQCSEADWDVGGVASSSRICGAGVQYSKQLKRFTFNFGGQNFTISMSPCTRTHSRFHNNTFKLYTNVFNCCLKLAQLGSAVI